MKKIILTLALILLISGCSSLDGFEQFMPDYENQDVKELPPDIISIENFNILPSGEINSGDQFTTSFIIKNKDSNLFDYSLRWTSTLINMMNVYNHRLLGG